MDSIEAIKFKACRDCDTLHEIEAIPFGCEATCSYCGTVLYRPKEHSIEYTLPLVIAGLILFIPANIYPIITVEILGRSQSNTVFSGVVELFHEGLWLVGGVIFMTGILIPLFKLLGMFIIIVHLHFNRAPFYLPRLFRAVKSVSVWGMMEVYLLGILVSYIKLSDMANVYVGVGFWAFVGLLISAVLVSVLSNEYVLWEKMESLK